MLRRQKHVLSQSTTPFACTLEKRTEKAFFCRDTGRVSQGRPAIQAVFRKFMWFVLMCLLCSLCCALWGFWCLDMAQLGAIPPLPFLSVSPLESMRSAWRCDTHSTKGVSQRCFARCPMETRQNVCDSILKGYCTIWVGISHRAAEVWEGF